MSADSSDEGFRKMRIDEWHLGEAEFPFSLQLCQQMALAQQAFGAFVAEGDFGRSLGVDTKN